jgi:hypothetical protein
MDPGGRAATTSDLANWVAIQTTAAISSATLYNRTVTPFLSSILGLFFIPLVVCIYQNISNLCFNVCELFVKLLLICLTNFHSSSLACNLIMGLPCTCKILSSGSPGVKLQDIYPPTFNSAARPQKKETPLVLFLALS